jgi:hypothetical protein
MASEFTGTSVSCPCCSVVLRVGILPSPQQTNEGDGWWFECNQCKHRWWFSAFGAGRTESVERLRQIMMEFDDSRESSYLSSPPIDEKSEPATMSSLPRGPTDCSCISANVLDAPYPPPSVQKKSDDGNNFQNYSTESSSLSEQPDFNDFQMELILKDPRNKEVLEGKFGENFFPKKKETAERLLEKVEEPENNTIKTKRQRPQLHVVENVQKYSYRRVLPDQYLQKKGLIVKPRVIRSRSVSPPEEITQSPNSNQSQNNAQSLEKNKKFDEDRHGDGDFQKTFITGEMEMREEQEILEQGTRYIKDPESVSSNMLVLPDLPDEHPRQNRWHFFKRKPLRQVKSSVAREIPKEEDASPHIDEKIDKSVSCFAISEEGKAPVVIPFLKESGQVLPPLMPDYQAFSSQVAKIPVEKEKKEIHWHFGKAWFISLIGILTVFAAYFSYIHKDSVFKMWESPISSSKKAIPENLSLERVSYSLIPDKAASKITVVGEIVNNTDSSLGVSPLRIKIFSKGAKKLLMAWSYSPTVSAILPNEHSLFQIERALRLDPTKEIHVEVSFIRRGPSRSRQ